MAKRPKPFIFTQADYDAEMARAKAAFIKKHDMTPLEFYNKHRVAAGPAANDVNDDGEHQEVN